MTKSDLITKVRDSIVSGNQKEAELATDEFSKQQSILFAEKIKDYRCSESGLWYLNNTGKAYGISELFDKVNS